MEKKNRRWSFLEIPYTILFIAISCGLINKSFLLVFPNQKELGLFHWSYNIAIALILGLVGYKIEKERIAKEKSKSVQRNASKKL